jgi:hypothetical protein
MPVDRQLSEWIIYNSQMTGGVENSAPLHAHISRSSGRCYDLSFEAVLQEYLQFPYEYYLFALPFWGYYCKLSLQTVPNHSITRIRIGRKRWRNNTADNSVSEDIGQSLHTCTCSELQKWTLFAGSRGCKAWIIGVLSDLNFSNFVVLIALDFWYSVSRAIPFSDLVDVFQSFGRGGEAELLPSSV